MLELLVWVQRQGGFTGTLQHGAHPRRVRSTTSGSERQEGENARLDGTTERAITQSDDAHPGSRPQPSASDGDSDPG
jgi:hypothetical protein